MQANTKKPVTYKRQTFLVCFVEKKTDKIKYKN